MEQASHPACSTGESEGRQQMNADASDRRTDTTVLVVDRTAAGRFALGVVLRRAGHQVVAVGTGHEALVELDVRRRKGALPDVALVDVELPDMSGFELCRRLQGPAAHGRAARRALLGR